MEKLYFTRQSDGKTFEQSCRPDNQISDPNFKHNFSFPIMQIYGFMKDHDLAVLHHQKGFSIIAKIWKSDHNGAAILRNLRIIGQYSILPEIFHSSFSKERNVFYGMWEHEYYNDYFIGDFRIRSVRTEIKISTGESFTSEVNVWFKTVTPVLENIKKVQLEIFDAPYLVNYENPQDIAD